ncbi:MFS transporter [Actinotalea sp. K2]|uniref:MFS transporter n=1 Tax=Actinotalea sp. K2 TaxID=2939438 RepID=UPI002017DAC1|nr:MFS transporter [Actinotalea sp. K2]MCL3860435.1 MFS transporter [Actinotalea sp. K2]
MAHPSHPAVHPWRGRYVVLAGIVLVALNLRIAVASVSPILDVVRQDVALSPAEAGLLGTVPVASFALFGSLAPLIARRFGLEPTLAAAMLLSAVGEVVRSTTDTSGGFLGWSVIALAGMGMGNVLLPPIVKRYFPDRIGPVTAVYSVAMSFSTATPPLLAAPLAERLGWRISLASWAVVGLVAVVPWVVVVARSAAARGALTEVLRRAPEGTAALASRHRGSGRVWRSPLAWGLAVTFAMNSLNMYAILAWLPQILLDAGFSTEAGGRWLALIAILGLPASLGGPLLAARLRNPYGVVVGFVVCFAAGYLGLLLSPATGTWFWMVLLGLGPGTFPILLALINLRTRTSAGASTLSGFTQGIGYAIAGIGPVVVGVLYGATQAWVLPVLFLLVTLGVLLAAAAVACRPVMLEDGWGPRPRT